MSPIKVVERNIFGEIKNIFSIEEGQVRELPAIGGLITISGTRDGGWVKHNWMIDHKTIYLKVGDFDLFVPKLFNPPTYLYAYGFIHIQLLSEKEKQTPLLGKERLATI